MCVGLLNHSVCVCEHTHYHRASLITLGHKSKGTEELLFLSLPHTLKHTVDCLCQRVQWKTGTGIPPSHNAPFALSTTDERKDKITVADLSEPLTSIHSACGSLHLYVTSCLIHVLTVSLTDSCLTRGGYI